jgi:hypothetical protein
MASSRSERVHAIRLIPGRDGVSASMSGMRLRRLAAVVLLASGALVANAAPAAAHGIGGAQPTNARSRVLSITPAVAGLSVQVIQNGRRVELRNDSGADVIVTGYDGEPYLRVDPDGVFENTRSPAVYLNRTSTPPGHVPASYDSGAEPQWRKISDANHVRWHDHRAHYMGTGAFSASKWSIPLSVDGRPVVVAGDLAWIEPGPWWPWLVLGVVIALGVAFAARAAWRLTVMCTLAALSWSELLHVVGTWSDVADTTLARIGAQAISFAAIALGAYVCMRTSRVAPEAAAPFVLLAAVVFIVAGGIGDVASWTRSQLPSTLPGGAVRAQVALALGGGAGLIVAAAQRLVPVKEQSLPHTS